MRALVQRTSSASVSVDSVITGQIGRGFLVFLGIGKSDTEDDMTYLVDKVINLRVFSDEQGKFDRSVQDVGGEILLVSQFTLYADTRKGRRPGFSDAMSVHEAKELFIKATEYLTFTPYSKYTRIKKSTHTPKPNITRAVSNTLLQSIIRM